MYERSGIVAEPGALAYSRDRGAAGDWRGAISFDTATDDGEPNSGGAGRNAGVAIGYGGVLYWQHFKLPSDLPLSPPVHMGWASARGGIGAVLPECVAVRLDASAAEFARGSGDGPEGRGCGLAGAKTIVGRNALVVAQVAASLMLMTAAFLMCEASRRVGIGRRVRDGQPVDGELRSPVGAV